jgi:uncharacterized phage protein gp47/JayE
MLDNDIKYDAILDRMLERVDPVYHKDEGSFIYTALAPTALEHNLLYIDMQTLEKEMFADTASREYLIKHASERGITPKEATKAMWLAKMEPSELIVSNGERFNTSSLNLVVVSRESNGVFKLECETAGTAGNTLDHKLTPINYINGLTSATLTELVDAGTDDEDTEEFRARYLTALRKPASSGNAQDYYNWAMSVDGVGAAKVYPLADGAGTVKVVITDADKRAASSELVNEVAAYIETVRPIGATVTVKSAEELKINVNITCTLADGVAGNVLLDNFYNALTDYFESVAYSATVIPLSMVIKVLLDTELITDCTVTLNDASANVAVADDQVAVLGTMSIKHNG